MTSKDNAALWVLWLLTGFLCQRSMSFRQLCGSQLANTMTTLCNGRFSLSKRNVDLDDSDFDDMDTNNDLMGKYGEIANVDPASNLWKRDTGRGRFPGRHSNLDNSARGRKPSFSGLIAYQKKRYGQNVFKSKSATQHPLMSKNNQGARNSYQDYYYDYDNTYNYDNFNDRRPTAAVQEAYSDKVRRRKRQTRNVNIVTECCLQPCSITTLLTYCDAPVHSINNQKAILRWFGTGSRQSAITTTERPPTTTTRPPAQIIGSGIEFPSTYFYIADTLPTRGPLIARRRRHSRNHHNKNKDNNDINVN